MPLRLAYRIEFRNPARRSYPAWEQVQRRFETFAEAEAFGLNTFSDTTEWRVLSYTPKRRRR